MGRFICVMSLVCDIHHTSKVFLTVSSIVVIRINVTVADNGLGLATLRVHIHIRAQNTSCL